MIQIGELAKSAGVSTQTIRFYEREGLLARPPRAANGYRLYPRETARQVTFIRECHAAGFSLREIKPLIVLSRSGGTTCARMVTTLDRKIRATDEKLSALKKVRARLTALKSRCAPDSPDGACGALEELEGRQETHG